MRVLQMIDEMRLGGGAEELQCSFAAAVQDTGVEVVVLTLQENEPAAAAELTARGARLVSLPSRRFLDPARAASVMRFVRNNDFDVVHTHFVRSTILGTVAARAAGIPVVATLHNTRPNARLPRSLRALETWLLRGMADRVVAVGWETARAHRDRLGGRSVEVIPNAVAEAPKLPAAERAALRRELGVDPAQPLVIAVGRLHPQKSYDDLLHAFARVDPGRGAQLRIVGRGSQRTAIEAGIERLGLGDRVRLLGLRRDVPRLLAASDVFASAAAWEGLPVSILEAMAAGLPIVATAVGDVPHVVDESCGTLVPPGHPGQLAAVLDRVLADPVLRRDQGEAGRRRVAQHFGTHAWSSRLVALYREMCRRDDAAEGSARKEDPCASPW